MNHYGWIRMARARCSGFLSTSDVGYGTCTTLPYEGFRPGSLATLYICVGDYCNSAMSFCQQAVSNNTRPAAMPPFLSSFTSSISCLDDFYGVNRAFMLPPLGTTNGSSFCSLFAANYRGTQDTIRLCDIYMRPRLTMCRVGFTRHDNRSRRDAFSLESYDWNVLFNWGAARYVEGPRLGFPMRYYYEPTNLLFILVDPNGGPTETAACYCTTNNCNADLFTCTSGLNYNVFSIYGKNWTSAATPLTTSVATPLTTSARITTSTTGASSATTIGNGRTSGILQVKLFSLDVYGFVMINIVLPSRLKR